MSATMRSSSFAARQNSCLEITISDGKWGAILELLAAITRVLTSRMKKRLRLWLTKLINLLVYANYIDIKWRVKNYQNLKKIMKSSRRNSKCASLLLDFLFQAWSIVPFRVSSCWRQSDSQIFHGWEAVRATLSVSDKSSQSWAALLFLSLFSSSGQQVLWEGAAENPAEGASASS